MICFGCSVKGCMMGCGRLDVYRRAIALLIDIDGGDICGRTGRTRWEALAHRRWKKVACAVRLFLAFRESVQRSLAPGGIAYERAREDFESCVKRVSG